MRVIWYYLGKSTTLVKDTTTVLHSMEIVIFYSIVFHRMLVTYNEDFFVS